MARVGHDDGVLCARLFTLWCIEIYLFMRFMLLPRSGITARDTEAPHLGDPKAGALFTCAALCKRKEGVSAASLTRTSLDMPAASTANRPCKPGGVEGKWWVRR